MQIILELGNYLIVVQLISRPARRKHQNKQFKTPGFCSALTMFDSTYTASVLRPHCPLLRAPHLRPGRRQVPLQRGRHQRRLPQEHRRLRTPRRHHPGQSRVEGGAKHHQNMHGIGTILQGGPSGCTLHFVDMKLRVMF